MIKTFLFLLFLIFFYNRQVNAQIVLPDSSYNQAGKIDLPLFNKIDIGYFSAIDEDGKLMITALSENPITVFGYYFLDLVLTRYDRNGDLDLSFGGGDGKISFTTNQYSPDIFPFIQIQTDQKILVSYSGGLIFGNSYDLFVYRFNPNGSIDTTFGTNGYFLFKTDPVNYKEVSIVKFDRDSKDNIYLSGTFTQGDFSFTNEIIVIKISKDGIIDSTFSTDGVEKYPYPASNSNFISRGISVLNDNQIVVGGFTNGFFSGRNAILLALDSTGGFDYNFDGNGYKVLNTNTKMNDMKKDSIGRLIVVGLTGGTSTEDIFVAALFPDGRLDSTFGINGKASFDLMGFNEGATCMAIAPDNKILIGGYVENPVSLKDFMVMRLNSNGTIDSTFNQTGFYQTEFTLGANKEEELNGITIDGKRIYLTGTVINSSSINHDAVVLCLKDNTATGLIEIQNQEFTINYYPNPTTNELTIEIDEKLIGINYILYDQLGRQLQNGTLNEQRSMINLADLAKGMYWVTLGNNRKHSFKVVKQ